MPLRSLQRSEAAGHKNEKVKEVSNLVKNGGSPTRRAADTPSKKLHNDEEPLPTGEGIVEETGHVDEEEVSELFFHQVAT